MTIDTSGSTADRPVLERSLSLWQVTVSGVGIVVGAGIRNDCLPVIRRLPVTHLAGVRSIGVIALSLVLASCSAPAEVVQADLDREVCGSFYAFVAESGSRPMTQLEMEERAGDLDQLADGVSVALAKDVSKFTDAIRSQNSSRIVDSLQSVSIGCSEVLTGAPSS